MRAPPSRSERTSSGLRLCAVPATTSKPGRAAPTKKGRQPAAPPPARDTAMTRWATRHGELLWATGVGAVALVVYLASFSSNVQFGDSSESIAGVKSLGIAHAPGYVSYIVAAKAFTLIEPFGSLALRVNLFSVVCSVAAVVLAFHRPADRQ